jgi:hypothetical protein
MRAGEIQFLESLLQKFPGFKPLFLGATVWLGLICAKKNMAREILQPQRLRRFHQLASHETDVNQEFQAVQFRIWKTC